MADHHHPGLLSPLWRLPAAVVRANLDVAESVAEAGVRGLRSAVGPRPGRGHETASDLAPRSDARTSLTARMNDLLSRALHDTRGAAELELFHRLVDQLTPDEARILGALADGQAVPLVHVFAWTRAGLTGHAALENASLIGKLANVNLPHLTPLYVTRLRGMGLLEVGPELPRLKDGYQILMADTGVMTAVKQASRTPLTARVERHSLRLSPLGHDLWQACFGTADEGEPEVRAPSPRDPTGPEVEQLGAPRR